MDYYQPFMDAKKSSMRLNCACSSIDTKVIANPSPFVPRAVRPIRFT